MYKNCTPRSNISAPVAPVFPSGKSLHEPSSVFSDVEKELTTVHRCPSLHRLNVLEFKDIRMILLLYCKLHLLLYFFLCFERSLAHISEACSGYTEYWGHHISPSEDILVMKRKTARNIYLLHRSLKSFLQRNAPITRNTL